MRDFRLQSLPRDPVLWLAMLGVGTMLATLGLLSYRGYNSGMLDLGAMTQAIMSVLRGQPLVTTGPGGNFSRLAGHVELIYVAFVPLLALWRDPQPLLLAQAALVALGALPAYRIARRRLDSRLAARCAALIYLLYPVALTAALFDFHGDTLAMPLLMFALDAADRRAWRAYAIWVALALACKLYIVVPVAGIGAYLFLWGGARRAGLISGLVAVAYGALVFFGVREAFAPPQLASAASAYVGHYFGALDTLGATLAPRLLNAVVIVGPAMLLAWRGWRWLLPALPLAAAALLSTGPGAGFHFSSHHYATVVPFVVMAVIDGAARLQAAAAAAPPGMPVRRWRADLVFATLIVGLTSALLVRQPLSPLFWLPGPAGGLDPSAYGLTARDRLKDAFLATYAPPRAAPVAASMFLAPRLADRETLYVVRYPDDPGGERLPALLPQVDYVLADALFDWRVAEGATVLGGAAYERREIALLLRDPALGLTAAADGLLRFERNAPASARLAQEVAIVPAHDLAEQTAYFGPIRLLGAAVEPLGGRRYQARFAWTATAPLPADRSLIAVSTLDGVAGRIVHLPTFALLPTAVWPVGAIIREEFDLELPADLPPGRYTWRVAWYDPAHAEAYATDERSRFMGAAPVAVATIELSPGGRYGLR
ncbi:MAG: DUF2079 domain-containing protein [Chloroflexi bacterium]|nr:DUF2079 domain-containing protein [Chloroflexota bacterium]